MQGCGERFTGMGFGYLAAGLPLLTALSAVICGIDDGVGVLRGLPKLTRLNLSWNSCITDVGLQVRPRPRTRIPC